MSKHALIFCSALSLVTTLLAQTPGQAPKKIESKPAKVAAPTREYANPPRLSWEASNKEPYRDVILYPGTLRGVVEQLDLLYSSVQLKKGPVEYAMPNLVWTPETMELPVSAALRLFEVNAIDALTLIGAAAGCKLEPIESAQTDAKERRIIGYKFVRLEPGMGRMSGGGVGFDPLTGGGGSMFGAAGGGGVGSVRAVGSADPFASSPVGVTAKAVPGLPGNTTVTSTAGTTARGNLKELQEQLLRLQQTLNDEHPRVVELKRELETIKRISLERPMTRVYAMGGIIMGAQDEQALKLLRIQKTISEALHGEEIDEKSVKVNYHDGTNVLVVRAPEAAQELVGQLIEALRENAKADTAKPKPSP
jgi:hypothetical protein